MKTSMFAALLLASTFIAGGAAAQPAPFNATGVTMGHWHIISNNVDANKKLFLAMGAKMFDVGGNPLMMFPGVYINLNLGQEKGEGGTVGWSSITSASSSTTCRSRSRSGRLPA